MYYFCSSGIAYAYLRVRDPSVWKYIKGIGAIKTQPEARLSTVEDDLVDNLSAFLSSTLNVELVYSILTGVNRLLESPQLDAWTKG